MTELSQRFSHDETLRHIQKRLTVTAALDD